MILNFPQLLNNSIALANIISLPSDHAVCHGWAQEPLLLQIPQDITQHLCTNVFTSWSFCHPLGCSKTKPSFVSRHDFFSLSLDRSVRAQTFLCYQTFICHVLQAAQGLTHKHMFWKMQVSVSRHFHKNSACQHLCDYIYNSNSGH